MNTLTKSYLLIAIASLQPVANFIQANITDQAFVFERTVFYFLVIFFIGCLAFLSLAFIFRSKNRSFFALAVAATILFFFNYHLFEPLVQGVDPSAEGFTLRLRYVVIMIALLYLITLLLLRKASGSRQTLIIVISILSTFPVIDLAKAAPHLYSQTAPKKIVPFKMPPRTERTKRQVSDLRLPNVYLMIADAMPAPETVSDILGGYRYHLPDQLKNLGFHMIENAVSNGLITYVSVPHFFAMDYFYENEEQVSSDKKARVLSAFSGYNPLMAGFRSRGYRYVQVGGTMHIARCSGYEDVCIGVTSWLQPLDEVFLTRTFIFPFLLKFKVSYQRFIEIPDVVKRLPSLMKESPFFLHAHMPMPHGPFRYHADCTKYEMPHSESGIDLKEWRNSAREQVSCAERQLLEFADAIIKQDPHGIIIIQSDHGLTSATVFSKEYFLYSKEEIRQLNGIFSAFYLPDRCASHLRPGLTPVNTFRIVFACLDGRSPDLLPDRVFLSNFEETLIKEITPHPIHGAAH